MLTGKKQESIAPACRTRHRELLSLARLAGPLAVVQLGYQLTGVVDTALAGRFGELAMAATGLGSSVFFGVSVLGIGIAMGLDPMAAQAFGAGETRRARSLLWQGVYVAMGIALPLSACVIFLAVALEYLGIEKELAEQTRAYIFARLPSIFPLFAAVAVRSYLQAARLTRPIVWASIWTNIFNLIADYLLLFGDDGLRSLGLPAVGLPSMGVVGIGLASVLATAAQLMSLLWALRRIEVEPGETSLMAVSWPTIWRLIALGTPIGLHLLLEIGVFATVQVLIGGMGVRATAAHQVAINIVGMTFAICVGIGSATSVQVGRAIGQQDSAATRRAGFFGIALGAAFMTVAALAMWFAPEALARVLTDEVGVVAYGAQLITIAGFFQLADGIQAVAAGALRGAGATQWTMWVNLVGHWGITLPCGLLLAYGFEWGPAGFWWGLTAGLLAISIACAMKFERMSRATIARLDADEHHNKVAKAS